MEEVEKVSFSPVNLLEGAELSDDKMLQGRANIYSDSQRRRIGPGFRKLPVNDQADWTPANQVTSGDGRFVEGKLQRSDLIKQNDYAQAGEFYHTLSPQEKEHLVGNIAADLKGIDQDIKEVVLSYFHQASSELGEAIAKHV